MKIDNVEEVYRLSSGNPSILPGGYTTKPAETRRVENAIKDIMKSSEFLQFEKSKDYLHYDKFTSNDDSIKIKLIEQLRLDSNVVMRPVGPANMLIDRSLILFPSGLRIIWCKNNPKIVICDSMKPVSGCEVQVNTVFVESLETSLENLIDLEVGEKGKRCE